MGMFRKFIIYLFEKYCSPKDYIKKYLSDNHGSVKLNDGTFAVNQSESFHTYCYTIAHVEWRKQNPLPPEQLF